MAKIYLASSWKNNDQPQILQRLMGEGHEVYDFRNPPCRVNRVESFNGFMRRAVIGVWHQISVKHLGRYASEATFRWNRKADACLDRMVRLVKNGEGRVLSYAFLTAKAA